MAEILAVCISKKKGTQKRPVPECRLIEGHGCEGDAHAGPWHRQVSLLADESAETMRQKGVEIGPGDFGENILTKGIEVKSLPIGTRLCLGDKVLLKVTQIGKECHDRCAIYYKVGDCVMPREGIFAEVVTGGVLKPGDEIQVVGDD
ncbi:MAG: MOSC domain-containing protein [Planctomycetes bacterium]|nr:MOSC domain-containing protein [Planctomycetota bacterium]